MSHRSRKGVYQYDERILELRKQGLTYTAIAERLHISTSTVVTCMRRNGVRGWLEKQHGKDREIIDLRKRGLSCRETAERLGIAVTTVFSCMRRHGLQGVYRVKAQAKERKPYSPRKKKIPRGAFSLVIVGMQPGVLAKALVGLARLAVAQVYLPDAQQ